MAYRKFKGDQLFIGNSWAPANSVLITSDQGKIEAIVQEAEAGEDIQYLEGILCPGMINAHCHLELSHMKGKIPPNTGMVPFLLSVMSQRQDDLSEIQSAMQLADNAMYASGIVAVGDICNTTHSLQVKQNSSIRYHNFIEASGFTGALAAQRFKQAGSLYQSFHEIGGTTIVPHAPYSVSPELFQLIDQAEPNSIRCMHNQESLAEESFFITGQSALRDLYATIGVDIGFYQPPGTSSLKAVLPFLLNCKNLLLVHNVTTSEEDLQWMTQATSNNTPAVYFCLCPNANQYINQAIPSPAVLRTNQNKLVLGTDSLASNYQLSITEEINSLLATYPHLKMEQLLQWATLNGAKALQMEDQLGSFERGKTPGIVQIRQTQSYRIL